MADSGRNNGFGVVCTSSATSLESTCVSSGGIISSLGLSLHQRNHVTHCIPIDVKTCYARLAGKYFTLYLVQLYLFRRVLAHFF